MKKINSKSSVKMGFVVMAGLALLSSCVRQKDCEYGLPNKFVYLSEPYMSDGHKIVAHSYDMDGRNKQEINNRSKHLFEIAKEIWKLPETSETKEKEEVGTLDPYIKTNVRYWAMCKEQLANSQIFETNQKPKDQSYFRLPINSKSAYIYLRINSISKEVKTPQNSVSENEPSQSVKQGVLLTD